MPIDWSLALNAFTGLAGAAIGGYFTLRAADRSFKLGREAAADDAASEKREKLDVDVWRMTHRFRQICAAIEGANNGLTKQLGRLSTPTDEGVWRAIMPTTLSSDPGVFSADELLALVRTNHAEQLNDLLEIQEWLRALAARLSTYARVREEITALYGKEIASGCTDEELLRIDPRFGGVAVLACDIRDTVQAAYRAMKPVELRFWQSHSDIHKRIGFSAAIKANDQVTELAAPQIQE